MRWIILRCSGSKTLGLARSLSEDGFEAWSPSETIQKRARDGDKPEPVTAPLTPSFVFARADRLLDLLALSHSPTLNYQVWDREQRRMVTRGHAYFRVFRHLGEVATIPDAQLEALRRLEGKRTAAPEVEPIEVGTRVRLGQSGFEGLEGEVIASRKSYTTVEVEGWMIPVDFPTWTLRQHLDADAQDDVSDVKALNARAA